MIRMTPWRLTTLQCSQIGFTLLRTFTDTPSIESLEKSSAAKTRNNNRAPDNTTQGAACDVTAHGVLPRQSTPRCSSVRSPRAGSRRCRDRPAENEVPGPALAASGRRHDTRLVLVASPASRTPGNQYRERSAKPPTGPRRLCPLQTTRGHRRQPRARQAHDLSLTVSTSPAGPTPRSSDRRRRATSARSPLRLRTTLIARRALPRPSSIARPPVAWTVSRRTPRRRSGPHARPRRCSGYRGA